MKNINTPEELYRELENLDTHNSVARFCIPGKGQFSLVYENKTKSIQEEVEEDKELEEMFRESRKEYKEGKYKSTDQVIKDLYKQD